MQLAIRNMKQSFRVWCRLVDFGTTRGFGIGMLLLMLAASTSVWGNDNLTSGSGAGETLRYPDLVKRLTDLDHLAVLPPVGEQGALASSYDRRSQYDAAHDKYIAWDANADGNGIVRKEGDNDVLAEINGPGCIWRMWSATPTNGHIKIYLDGAAEPAVDLPFKGYFDRKNEPFTRLNMVYMTSANGYNNYTPIPFQKSCKIVAEKDWGKYYYFNYTRFAPGTTVPTFHLPLGPDDLKALDQANETFARAGQNPYPDRPGQKTETNDVTVPHGHKITVAELSGPQAITELKVKSQWPKDVDVQRMLLAQLTISITWDEDKEPAVWAPLGDFFATAAGMATFSTLPTGLLKDGTFYSYWYMPFGKKAKIEVTNDSDQDVALAWQISRAPLTKPADAYARFHAKWHRDVFPTGRADRKVDWTLLTTQGRGRYVGTQLHVWNPDGGWWGEGDDKFFVDGEKFPSSFGTGSEDYFGFAWCGSSPFVQALHSAPVNNAHLHVSVNRWHIADNIPFQTSFDGYIENYCQLDPHVITRYAAVAYWYLAAGGTDPHTTFPVSERAGWWNPPQMFCREDGVIEGIQLETLVQAKKNALILAYTGVDTIGTNKLLYCSVSIDRKAQLGFHVKNNGKYKLQACFGKGAHNGIFQLYLNGEKIGSVMDFYSPTGVLTDAIDLGDVTLQAGQQILSMELIEENSDRSKDTHIALDWRKARRIDLFWIKLTPVP